MTQYNMFKEVGKVLSPNMLQVFLNQRPVNTQFHLDNLEQIKWFYNHIVLLQ